MLQGRDGHGPADGDGGHHVWEQHQVAHRDEGHRTGDIFTGNDGQKKVGTVEMGDAIAARISSRSASLS